MIAPLRSDDGESETSLVHGWTPLNSSASPACWGAEYEPGAPDRDDDGLCPASPPQPAHASTAALETARTPWRCERVAAVKRRIAIIGWSAVRVVNVHTRLLCP